MTVFHTSESQLKKAYKRGVETLSGVSVGLLQQEETQTHCRNKQPTDNEQDLWAYLSHRIEWGVSLHCEKYQSEGRSLALEFSVWY